MPENPGNFLFVCKGNIIRSAFAEFRSRQLLHKGAGNEKVIQSGGVDAVNHTPSPENAVTAASDFKIDLTAHRSKNITPQMMKDADMVLVMEVWHEEALRKKYPEFAHKIYLLSLFDGDYVKWSESYYRYNIPDPYGKEIEEFQTAFNRIDKCLNNLFQTIS